MLGILTGQRGLLQPPVEGYLQSLAPQERAAVAEYYQRCFGKELPESAVPTPPES